MYKLVEVKEYGFKSGNIRRRKVVLGVFFTYDDAVEAWDMLPGLDFRSIHIEYEVLVNM